jgi:isoleucyl-tRNA synthetase
VSIPRRFDEAALRQTAGNFLVTLRNVYAFFAQYANFGWAPSDADPAPADRPALDRWVLGRLAAAGARRRRAARRLRPHRGRAPRDGVLRRRREQVVRALSRPRFWFEGASRRPTRAPRSRRCTRCSS